jgi:hypothetical protein
MTAIDFPSLKHSNETSTPETRSSITTSSPALPNFPSYAHDERTREQKRKRRGENRRERERESEFVNRIPGVI